MTTPTIEDVAAALARVGGEVSGITAAVDPPPTALSPARLPLLYVLTGSAEDDAGQENSASGLNYEKRTYRVRVAVTGVGQATANVRETRCRPLLGNLKAQYRTQSGLGLKFVQKVAVTGDTGVGILPDYDEQYVGFEVQVTVTMITPYRRARGE